MKEREEEAKNIRNTMYTDPEMALMLCESQGFELEDIICKDKEIMMKDKRFYFLCELSNDSIEKDVINCDIFIAPFFLEEHKRYGCVNLVAHCFLFKNIELYLINTNNCNGEGFIENKAYSKYLPFFERQLFFIKKKWKKIKDNLNFRISVALNI
jgi:hypothetical protein